MEAGRKLGPYEIVEQIGKGGMGEVYLAQDTRLGRKVAIKVLPEEFAGDPERLARFTQEARAAAALNHPHIAAVHDVGLEDGVHFMVQEHLEGRTLRAAIAEGRLPLKTGLKLAIEIAEGLAAAHAEGIVHRDLKPDNVFVTPDGHAKILDFGLAKLTELNAPSGDGSASMSPTVLGTVAGQMMGTAGYMAPEQVEGIDVNHRADIFAFGCVLYELVAGQQAFRGKNLVDTLHRVSNVEPDGLVTIDGSLPAQLQRILDKALAKDPAGRYQTAGDLAVDLRALAAAVASGEATPVALEGARAGAGLATGAVVGIAVACLLVGWLASNLLSSSEADPGTVTHFEFDLYETDGFTNPAFRPLSISPDGTKVAFGDEGLVRLRDFSDPALKDVRGATTPKTPIFSPDGEWIAFHSGGELQKVPLAGGAPIRLATVGAPSGMSWGTDGFLLLAVSEQGIVRVPENGGDPGVLVEAGEGEGMQGPSLLPGGKWILFSLLDGEEGASNWSDAQIVAQEIESSERRVLVHGGVEAHYVTSGHVTFARDGNLLAVPFDAKAVAVTGGAVPLVEGLPMARNGGAYYDVSPSGDLVYYLGNAGGGDSIRPALYDLDGNVEVLAFEPSDLDSHRIGPDGNRLAVTVRPEGADPAVWIYEIDRLATQRLTPEGLAAENPVWSPDGEWIYFTDRSAGDAITRVRSDFSGSPEPVGGADAAGRPQDVSPDGSTLLVVTRGDSLDLALIDLESGESEVLVATSAIEVSARFSPDGRFVTYVSNESGDFEVYVRDLENGRRYVASTDGGSNPIWRPDGQMIYYERDASNTFMSVSVAYEPSFRLGSPVEMFKNEAGSAFPRDDVDISPDGRRLLVLTDSAPIAGADEDSRSNKIHVLLNWAQVLRERVRGR